MEHNEERQLQLAAGTELAATASAAMARAEIESAYIMAMRKPRTWADVRAKILAACERPVFAAKAEYQKPIGGSKITGPSIRFAEMAVQAAGNIKTSATVIYDDQNIRKIHVQVIDLENNISYGKEITLQKTVERKKVKQGQEVFGTRTNSFGETVYIVEATEDDLLVKQAAQESKIIRTCGLRMIPQDIIEEAMSVAKATRNKNIDPKAECNKILDAFSKLGVRPSDIASYLKKPIEQIVDADIDDLRQIYTAIKDGDAKWSDFLEDAEVVEGKEDANAKLARLKKEKDESKPKPDAKPEQPPVVEAEEANEAMVKIAELRKAAGVEKDIIFASVYKTLVGDANADKSIEELDAKAVKDLITGLQGMADRKNKK